LYIPNILMSKHFLLLSAPLGALLLLGACTDDNYDLSNIDKTVEVKVNDLVIPVNLGPVTLNSIIDLGENEDGAFTKELVDGKEIYVYNYDGSFNSNEIHINDINVESPGDLEPNVIKVDLDLPTQAPKRMRIPGLDEFHYKINRMTTEFQYNLKDVDHSIQTIDKIGISSLTYTIKMDIPTAVMSDSKEVELNNVKLEFPKGMTYKGGPAKSNIGTYDTATGDLTISSYKTTTGSVILTLTADALNFKAMDIALKDHNLDFDGEIVVREGEFILFPKPNAAEFPQTFDVDINYNLSDFEVITFNGEIDYIVEGLQFDDAVLSDIPDFLDQPDTRIKLGNPQIYLGINNSCAQYDLEGITKLQITPMRKINDIDVPGETLSMNSNIIVGYDKGDGPYKFAISPAGNKLTPIAGYENATKLPFSELGDVLNGDGLPAKLRIAFDSPRVQGLANQLPLGSDLNKIYGDYRFRAPLALADGSQIVYSGTEDDWSSDELENLYVDYLEVSAVVNSSIPLKVKLSAQILNENGDHLGQCEATELPALAENYPITIKITPDAGNQYISDIDGIYYEVWAISEADPNNPTETPALSPDMTLNLDKIRAKVSGKYIHKDDSDN
ncbi:MAG: hypothetical protein K2J15_02660, partial [Muribaculaceae bacterium]|nr:hypothetical protein [Muribaculaceae bacterium]